MTLLTSLYENSSIVAVFTSCWLSIRPYTNNIPVKKKYLIEQHKMHTLVIYIRQFWSFKIIVKYNGILTNLVA